jgi:hypothetical protein
MFEGTGMRCCTCKKCLFVKKNIEIGKWIHLPNQKIDFDKIFDKIPVTEYFHPPKLALSVTIKPIGVIWFSAGSWLYNKFEDACKKNDDIKIIKYNVITLKNPVNILKIKNIEDFILFCKKYIKEKYIDWKQIYDEGYYGVSFLFTKYYYLYNTHKEFEEMEKNNNIFNWHNSFDVESLCIFDLRAIEGKLIYEEINL